MIETNFAPKRSREEIDERKRVYRDRVGDLAVSSDALADLAISDAYGGITGKYYDRGITSIDSSPLSHNEESALALWNKSVEYTGVSPDV